jgi:hypothetical protein
MKRIIFFSTALCVSLVSCTNEEAIKAENQRIQDSLLRVQEDSLLNIYKSELESIAMKVNEVGRENGLLDISSSEDPTVDKEAILSRVESLNELLSSNQNELAALRKKMKNSNIKNAELESLIKTMEATIAQREAQMKELIQMLADKDAKIETILLRMDSMRVAKVELMEGMVQMDQEMHTVYYIVGESKDLKAKGLVTKDGGVLGIGASKKLDVAKIDPTLFQSADQRELKSIPLFSKKTKLITSHPEDSYEIRMNGNGEPESLEIKDNTRFWMATDYLVVEVSN